MAGLADILQLALADMSKGAAKPSLGSYMSAPLAAYGSPKNPLSQTPPQIDIKQFIQALTTMPDIQMPSHWGKQSAGRQPSHDPSTLMKDENWVNALAEFKKAYPGINEAELYDVIFKESSYNPKAQNASGAVGLFQFMPKTAKELGYTTEQILEMTPAEQLQVYGKYINHWGFDPATMPLALLQAKPSLIDSYDTLNPESVIYAKNSKAWKANPGWRSSNNGDITLGSLMRFYGRKWTPPK